MVSSSSRLLQDLENKQIQELELDRHVLIDTNPSQFFPHLHTVVLRVAGCITSLYLSLDIFDTDENEACWKQWFFQTLLPQLYNLQILRCYATEPSRIELPWSGLSQKLQTLVLTRCQIDNHIQSIRNHPTLVEIKFLDIIIHNNNSSTSTTTRTTLDQVVQVLSSIPKLETLDITVSTSASSFHNHHTHRRWDNKNNHHHHHSNYWDDDTCASITTTISTHQLRQLFQSCPRLTDMSLWDCGLTDDHLLRVIAPALQTSSQTLQFLSLRRNPRISHRAWCQFYTEHLPTIYGLQALYNDHAELLCTHQNPILRTTDTNSHYDSNRRQRRQSGNHHHHHCNDNDDDDDDMEEDHAANKMAELYLSLNQLGRGACLQNETTFLELLQDVSASPTAVFIILTENLSIFLPGE
jgi:hypothetical protein